MVLNLYPMNLAGCNSHPKCLDVSWVGLWILGYLIWMTVRFSLPKCFLWNSCKSLITYKGLSSGNYSQLLNCFVFLHSRSSPYFQMFLTMTSLHFFLPFFAILVQEHVSCPNWRARAQPNSFSVQDIWWELSKASREFWILHCWGELFHKYMRTRNLAAILWGPLVVHQSTPA